MMNLILWDRAWWLVLQTEPTILNVFATVIRVLPAGATVSAKWQSLDPVIDLAKLVPNYRAGPIPAMVLPPRSRCPLEAHAAAARQSSSELPVS